jgi:LmbE family N-acetylglucosaminyl deacetylase
VSAERSFVGDGTPDIDWHTRLSRIHITSRLVRDLVPQHARLVVVAPHPDDELLACAGLLAQHVAAKGQAVVVGVTDGEASHGEASHGEANHAAAAGCNATQLAHARHQERLEGLRRLRCTGVDVIRAGLPDGHVAQHTDKLYGQLLSLLRPCDVVVSTWRLDGHPDHDSTGSTAAKACLAAGCRLLEAPVWMWHWAAAEDARVPWHRLIALPLEPSAWHRKQHAVAAHKTQQSDRGAGLGAVLGAAILDRAAWQKEYFFV